MKLIDATWKGGSAYEVLILADKPPPCCLPAARTWTV